MLGEELLVGGDHGLAVLQRAAQKLQRVLDTAHGLDHDVDVVGSQQLIPTGHGACAGRHVGGLDGLAAANGGDDELHATAPLDQFRVLGDDVGGGAADGSKADNSYPDLFHRV